MWLILKLNSVTRTNIIYYFLWFCSPARAMVSCGSAAQRGLWPPVALQPSAGYGLLWLCSPARAMASCGSAAQRELWPPVVLQPSAGYGLLVPRGFVTSHNNAPQSIGLLWTGDQSVAKTSTRQLTTNTTDKHSCPRRDSNPHSQ
jgi:hypothetical protein